MAGALRRMGTSVVGRFRGAAPLVGAHLFATTSPILFQFFIGRTVCWFRSKGLRWETAAPRGWLEGDPGIYAVHFDGTDDPRAAGYAAEFEGADGKSLEPDAYQMYRLDHASWLDKRGTDGGDDWLDEDGVP